MVRHNAARGLAVEGENCCRLHSEKKYIDNLKPQRGHGGEAVVGPWRRGYGSGKPLSSSTRDNWIKNYKVDNCFRYN